MCENFTTWQGISAGTAFTGLMLRITVEEAKQGR